MPAIECTCTSTPVKLDCFYLDHIIQIIQIIFCCRVTTQELAN